MSDNETVELASAYPFAETLQRLRSAIESAGMRIFAEIDHAEAAASVGLTMPPTVVLVYGNPRGGTPLMLAAPLIALDLPLRVLVREDASGQALVAFHDALSLTRSVGLGDEMAANLRKAESMVAKAVTQGN
jgi:uncharacterized protein (DUF302 family)